MLASPTPAAWPTAVRPTATPLPSEPTQAFLALLRGNCLTCAGAAWGPLRATHHTPPGAPMHSWAPREFLPSEDDLTPGRVEGRGEGVQAESPLPVEPRNARASIKEPRGQSPDGEALLQAPLPGHTCVAPGRLRA